MTVGWFVCVIMDVHSLPVAAVHIEKNDDKAQAVTGQVGASKEPGEPSCSMLPPRHLSEDKKIEQSEQVKFDLILFKIKIPLAGRGRSIILRLRKMGMMEMWFLHQPVRIRTMLMLGQSQPLQEGRDRDILCNSNSNSNNSNNINIHTVRQWWGIFRMVQYPGCQKTGLESGEPGKREVLSYSFMFRFLILPCSLHCNCWWTSFIMSLPCNLFFPPAKPNEEDHCVIKGQ